MPLSLIGAEKRELDTPILCIDLDRMESNIRRMAGYCREHGVAWRPHEKCHKTPAIALQEIAAGAIGVTCAKVSEAEVMAAGGVRDILIANMIVGERKWERVAALCRHADPIVASDHYAQVEPLAAVCRRRGVEVRVIIEVNLGLDRVGISPGRDTLELARAIDNLEGMKFAGIMGYEGHLLQIAEPADKERQIRESMQTLVGCKDQIGKSGIACDIVSAGGTGSYQYTVKCPGVTEIQAGGGIFMDPFYRLNCQVHDLEYALTVLATVVSRPTLERAVLDSGRKTMNPDVALPVVVGHDDAVVKRLSAEHCELTLGPKSQDLKIGDQVELVVGYGDFTTVLHDEFYGFRGNRLETVWPILGRGKLQ
ncbi:MAG: DSD1 family PLP-dependent enzyme [Planctomycetaceae bacterium]|nr:DSD1 family PLP-dependent enzyme [Planctomycetaceae bacterium]